MDKDQQTDLNEGEKPSEPHCKLSAPAPNAVRFFENQLRRAVTHPLFSLHRRSCSRLRFPAARLLLQNARMSAQLLGVLAPRIQTVLGASVLRTYAVPKHAHQADSERRREESRKKGRRKEKKEREKFRIALMRPGLSERISTNVVPKDCSRSEGIRIHISTAR